MVYRGNQRVCPRCSVGMDELHTTVGHRFERCGACLGNWVDMGTLVQMYERLRPGEGAPPMATRVDSTPVLRCPACTRPMVKVQLLQLHLDWCQEHGVWFDDAELEHTLYRYAMNE